MLINALRGHLAEFGIVAAAGRHRVADLLNLLQDADDAEVPALAREALRSLIAELHTLERRIEAIESVIVREHKANPVSRRLATIPGIGPITASAISATIVDPSAFKSGRELAAWIGLVPRQHSSGGKQKLGRVSKQGDRYLRRLLTVGATSVMPVDHFAHVYRSLAATALGRRDQRLDQPPLSVSQVGRVAQLVAVIAMAILGRPHRAPRGSVSRDELQPIASDQAHSANRFK